MDGRHRTLRLALAQLPVRLREAARLFNELTGLRAVTSLRTVLDDHAAPSAMAPPVHPRCATLLRRTGGEAPCDDQWRWHLRTGQRTRAVHQHVCPLGLWCSCVPIFYGETLIGIAKVVAGPETEEHRFSVAVQALELTVSRVCQDFHVASLTEEMNGLRRQVADLQKVRGSSRSILKGSIGTDAARAERLPAGQAGSLVDRTLTYLARHHLDPGLSLAEVSRAVGSNGKYLTRLFTRNVGQHMHAYILGLRVQHACRLLLSTDAQVKTIAYESGFRGPERFRRAFREHVGVSPAAYRRIFTGS